MAINLTIVLNPQTKKGRFFYSGQIAVRDSVSLILRGLTVSDTPKLVIKQNGIGVAEITSFTWDTDHHTATLDLNTTELVAAFVNQSNQALLSCSIFVYDTGSLFMNETIDIMNNPYVDGMASPSPAGTEFMAADILSANEILVEETAVAIAEQRVVGRITGGDVKGLTKVELLTLLNVQEGAQQNNTANEGNAITFNGKAVNWISIEEGSIWQYNDTTKKYDSRVIPLNTDNVHNANQLQGLDLVLNNPSELDMMVWDTVTNAFHLISPNSLMNTLSVRHEIVLALATSTSAPPTESAGDRYMLDAAGTPHADWDGVGQGQIAVFADGAWSEELFLEGHVVQSDAVNMDIELADAQIQYRNVHHSNRDELDTIDQDMATTDDVTFNSMTVSDLIASQVVETDGAKKLITSAKNDAYNKSFGTGSGDVCEGNDSRLSDTRTPISHASSHQSGSGDEIKLDNLGAPDDNTDLDATITAHGLLPKLSGNASDSFKGDGTWGVAPASSLGVANRKQIMQLQQQVDSAEYEDGFIDTFSDETMIDSGNTTAVYDGVEDAFRTQVGRSEDSFINSFDTALVSDSSSVQNYSHRQQIPTAFLNEDGTIVRVKVMSGGGNGLYIDNISIVEQDSGADGTTTPTEILFEGTSGVQILKGNMYSYSDPLVYTIDKTKSYLLIADFSSSATYDSVKYSSVTGITNYSKAGIDSYNQQTVTGF
ncbi:MAG: hypothetical protein ACTSYA_05640, partial [Candidatus Kariarchaeaceae archaeon]